MIEKTTLQRDGIALTTLSARPAGAAIGGVVVAQEIFGLTEHIADMCGVFAEAGYAVLAPGLYDRVEKDFLAMHDAQGIAKGRAAAASTPWPQAIADMQAAINALPQPRYIVGFCYGGAVAWSAAARCTGLKAAACFYGRLIADRIAPAPIVPVMLHYGAHDASIPAENYEAVRAAAPDAPLYLYDAGHGFCRDGSADYHAPSCELALTRTIDWFARWR